MKPGMSHGAENHGENHLFSYFDVSPVSFLGCADTPCRKERGAGENICGGAWGGFACDPRIIVNIPEMAAIPRRLRFPGGAAGLSGPIAPW